MSTVTRAAVYTARIAAVTAAAPVLVGAAGSAATAELVGWELRQLAGSPLSAEARRLKAEYRERGAVRDSGAYTPGQQGHARDGPRPAGCLELGALGTPTYRVLMETIP
jgi:hypothetical protein